MYTKHAHVATSSPAHTDTDGFKIYANFLYFSYQDTVGGRSKREGTYVYIWSIHFIGQQKLTQHCKATIFQKKEKSNVLSFFFFSLRGYSQWLGGKESTCNAGDLQAMQVRSLGQEDPLE